MNKLEFAKNYIYLNRGKLISFDERPYLPAIYAVDTGNLVIRASRQVEKSTFLAVTILYEATCNPDARMLLVCPRQDQARSLSRKRIRPLLEQSPFLRRVLSKRGDRDAVMEYQFKTGAMLTIKGAFHSADECRGESATMLLADEFQDLSSGELPVLQETLSHAKNGRIILMGTPKMEDNHLETMFRQSTASLWTLTCSVCAHETAIDERCLGPIGLACPKCQAALDSSQGRWVAGNPNSQWGQGFSISHPMVPWIEYHDILDRQAFYGYAKFRNEVLGLSTTMGDHVVTLEELEQCCTGTPMAQRFNMISNPHSAPLIAGVDWGGGAHARTAIVIGRMRSDYIFEICFLGTIQPREESDQVLSEVLRICRNFGVVAIAADGGGNGSIYNRMLWKDIQPPRGIWGLFYSQSKQPPVVDGVLTKWTIHRTGSISTVFGRIKHQKLLFPRRSDLGNLLNEFACERSEYDAAQRDRVFVCPEDQTDDVLHATNYALSLAILFHTSTQEYD